MDGIEINEKLSDFLKVFEILFTFILIFLYSILLVYRDVL